MVNATPRPLYLRESDPVPIGLEAEWAPGAVWTGAENLAPTGIRSPDHVARGESLYRLSYPGPHRKIVKLQTVWIRGVSLRICVIYCACEEPGVALLFIFVYDSLFSFSSLLFLASFRFNVQLYRIYNLPPFLNPVIVAYSSRVLIIDINLSDVTVAAQFKAWICGRWDYGFESCRWHECLSVVSVVCCQVEVSVSGRSLVQRSPTECSVSEYDRESSIMRSLTRSCCAMREESKSIDFNV